MEKVVTFGRSLVNSVSFSDSGYSDLFLCFPTLPVSPIPHLVPYKGTKYPVFLCCQVKYVLMSVVTCYIWLTPFCEGPLGRVVVENFAFVFMVAEGFKVLADLIDY